MSNLSGVYEIKVDFEKGSENPSRIFKAMSGMIDALATIDEGLVDSFGASLESKLILEDVEVGSLKTRIRTVISTIDDDALKDLDWKKAVGSFLVKGKRRILKHLEDRHEITSIEQVHEIQKDIAKLAEETEVNKIPFYTSVQSKVLLESLSKLYIATSNLSSTDSAFYISSEGAVRIPQGLYIPTQTIENILTREKIESEAEMILRIKKPDYLGTSMWDVQFNNRTIQVKIMDLNWLNEFQTRKHDVRPGDSLRAKVLVEVSYGFDNNVVAEHYNVIRVIEVIKNDSAHTMSLSLFNEEMGTN